MGDSARSQSRGDLTRGETRGAFGDLARWHPLDRAWERLYRANSSRVINVRTSRGSISMELAFGRALGHCRSARAREGLGNGNLADPVEAPSDDVVRC